MKLYAAYGSNLNTEQMYTRCPGAIPMVGGILQDYKLVFRRGFLTVEPEKGQQVQIGIWRITEYDERRLDLYEGCPNFYRKETVKVTIGSSEQECLIYIMQDGFPIEKPSRGYLKTVLEGYEYFRFDMDPLLDAYNLTTSLTTNSGQI